MKERWKRLGIAAVFLLVAVPARAETIQITSGGFVWSGSTEPTPIMLAGDGFTFGGIGHTTGVFMPGLQCFVPECLAGTTIDLRAHWSGGDLPGVAMLNGTTYTPLGGQAPNSASLLAEWNGTLTIPTDFTGGTLSAPFTFFGRFDTPDVGVVLLSGTGTASLDFRTFPVFDPPFPDTTGAFQLTSARYEFDSAAPVPEPASMMLIGTGLIGLAGLRRRFARGDH